jgi:hypothetical protein
MIFFVPNFAAGFLNIAITPPAIAVLTGMGGLIIGRGAFNYLVSNQNNIGIIKNLLVTHIITHLLGLSADVWAFWIMLKL